MDKDGGRHVPQGAWDSQEHLNQATGILVDFIKRIRTSDGFRHCTAEQQLKGLLADQHWLALFAVCLALFSFVIVSAGGIAAYNMGDGNVHSYENVDVNTTGGDYSNDVVARAQWYKNNRSF